MTKKIFTVAALMMTTACIPSFAASVEAPASPVAEKTSAVRLALFDDWRGEHRHHRRHHDDDEDDEDEHHGHHHGAHHAERGGANRPADPNAPNAPVPDNGVFKSRPKVDVQ